MTKLENHWKFVKQDYKLEKILGKGSFGQVIKAIHRSSKTECAIKCMPYKQDNLRSLRQVTREI